MRSSILAITLLVLLLAVASPASAQLVGDDTAPGSSCAGFPDGATRMTADADLDGAQVVLICNGSVWQTSSGSAAAPNRGIQFNSGNSLAASPDLVFSSSGFLGVGTPDPWANLQISGNDQDTMLVVSNDSSTTDRWPAIDIRNYSGATDGAPALTLFRARGSVDTPLPLQASDAIGHLSFMGHKSGSPDWGIGSWIFSTASANWDGTSTSAQLQLATTPPGETWPVTRLTVTDIGNIGIGTETPASALHVSGGVAVGHDPAACTAQKDGTLRYTTGIAICPSGGVAVAGSCWYFGSGGQSCDTVCGNISLAYDSATQSYAGSGGDNVQCGAVLDALGASGSGDATSGSCTGANTVGCAWRTSSGGARRRCGNSATTAGASNANYQRACACGTGPIAGNPLWEYCDGGAETWSPFEHAAGGGSICPAGGVEVGGACWYHGWNGQSCADTCTERGLSYSDATRDYAGSGGSASVAQCNAVLIALHYGGSEATNGSCGQGVGCAVYEGWPSRCTSPATTAGAAASAERVCACE